MNANSEPLVCHVRIWLGTLDIYFTRFVHKTFYLGFKRHIPKFIKNNYNKPIKPQRVKVDLTLVFQLIDQ